jgi:hypothetical protein
MYTCTLVQLGLYVFVICLVCAQLKISALENLDKFYISLGSRNWTVLFKVPHIENGGGRKMTPADPVPANNM